MQGKLTKRKLLQIVIMLALLLGLVVYRTLTPPLTTQVHDATHCDLSQGACRLPLGDSAVLVSSSEQPIRPESPFLLRLHAPAIAPTNAYIEGRSMFMGRIPLQLRQEGGDWVAEGMVGACTHAGMVWQIVVELPGHSPLMIPFLVAEQ